MATSLVCVALPVLANVVVCGRGGPDKGAYVKANEAVLRQLPVFPGSRLREQSSDPVYAEENGPILGYTTLSEFELPQDAKTAEVAAFFRRRLEPQWRIVEKLEGPVLNFRRGRAFVSINLENGPNHLLEVAVDHDDRP